MFLLILCNFWYFFLMRFQKSSTTEKLIQYVAIKLNFGGKKCFQIK